MIHHTKLLGKSCLLIAAFFCGRVQGASVAVLAPVVEVKGSATCAGRGGLKGGTLRTGESLAEGSTFRTGSDGRVLLAPVPSVAVSEGKDTIASLLRLGVAKSGGAIQTRDVALQLDLGTLSFSLEKWGASKTSFSVQTPNGVMHARGSVGTITVLPPCVKIASLSGRVTFTPNDAAVVRAGMTTKWVKKSESPGPNVSATATGGPISIEAGWFLAICGVGADAKIRVIDTIARTWTGYTSDGAKLTTRDATAEELESTRALFEATLEHASLAVGYGLLDSEGAREITETLNRINQSFTSSGLTPIAAPAVGSTPKGSSAFAPVPGSPGFSGGSLNPANTSGEVISRER